MFKELLVCLFHNRKYREGFIRCLKCDRASVNKKKGSVLTALSSANGSVHKTKRSISNGSLSTSGVSNGLPLGSLTTGQVEQDHHSSCNGTNGTVNKAFDKAEPSSEVEDDFTSVINDNSNSEVSNDMTTPHKDTEITEHDVTLQLPATTDKQSALYDNLTSQIDTVTNANILKTPVKMAGEDMRQGTNPYESDI